MNEMTRFEVSWKQGRGSWSTALRETEEASRRQEQTAHASHDYSEPNEPPPSKWMCNTRLLKYALGTGF